MSLEIMIIDDEENMLSFLKKMLEKEGHAVSTFTSPEEALQMISINPPELVFTDFKMPQMNGMTVIERIKEINPATVIVMMTAFGSIETAVQAIKKGASDYLTKPFKLPEIKAIIHKAQKEIFQLNRLKTLEKEVEEKYSFYNIIAKSKPMLDIFATIRALGKTNSTVLIRGKSGTGKELVAKAIHYNSLRKHEPFVPVNCTALPEGLQESELFGHAKGAFTTAIYHKKGLFQEADKGTIFLDEVGHLGLPLQLKLLRVLQEKEIRRVGDTKNIKIDARVIAATNQDLEQAIAKGTFREDLFYRLNVIPIFLPDLKDRKEDIPLLVSYFLQKFSRQLGKKTPLIGEEAMTVLVNYQWPGNVRELENLIERITLLTKEGKIVTTDDLNLYLPFHYQTDLNLRSLDEIEKEYINKILTVTSGKKIEAAKILGIDRRTLLRKINKLKA